MSLELVPLSLDNFSDFAALLGGEEFGGCFCAVWTASGADWAERCRDATRPNLTEVRGRVERGEHVGFLVMENGAVVAWTGSGPKSGFPALATRLGARLTPLRDSLWFVGCLAVRRESRGRGLGGRIVEAVVAAARTAGAAAIEACPTRPWDEPRSYRGRLSLYERIGFCEVDSERDGAAEIVLMRLVL